MDGDYWAWLFEKIASAAIILLIVVAAACAFVGCCGGVFLGRTWR